MHQPTSFAERVALLDHLELRLMAGPDEATEAQVARLEQANACFVARLRSRIRHGRYTPAGLRRALARLAGDAHYDVLDQLVAGLLDEGEVPDEEREREPEMVFYQPTPARVILDLVSRLGPDDVLVDLGSGLGNVVVLAALLGPVRAIGVEFEPVYCAYAERVARSLGAANASFVNEDARSADLSAGTVFFLYTPFRGELLRQVLARLPEGCRIFCHGPIAAELPGAVAL